MNELHLHQLSEDHSLISLKYFNNNPIRLLNIIIIPSVINPFSFSIGINDDGIINSLFRHFKYKARSYVAKTI